MIEKASALDRVYRKLLLTKFFTRGWGSPGTLKRQFEFLRVLADRSKCQELVDENYPVNIDKDVQKGEVRIVDGHFRSPFDVYLPNVMPKEVKTARFQLIVPTQWPTERKPVCIHMAGTGDHFFWRRRTFLARPLIKEYGIGSLLLENPFYGLRKPKDQLRSSLHHVNDLFVMGGGLILEGLAMLHWCERQGFGPLGLTGMSLGGHMATLTATNWHKPIPLIPCLSWSSATPVFTEGVMSGAIPWHVLVTQYMGHTEYEGEIMRKLLKCKKNDAFTLGQEFVWNYPNSLENLRDVKIAGNKTVDNRGMTSVMDSVKVNDVKVEAGSETSTVGVWPMSKAELQSTVAASFQESTNDTVGSNLGGNRLNSSPEESMRGCTHNSSTCTCNRHGVNEMEAAKENDRTLPQRETDSSQFVSDSVLMSNLKSVEHIQKTTSNLDSSRNPSAGEKEDAIKLNENYTKVTSENKSSAFKQKLANGLDNYADLKKEALEFMRGVMDASTFVGNFSTPVDTSLIVVVSALRDAYVPRKGVPSLDHLWPGVEVRYIDCGHISAFLFKQPQFRRAINDAFNKYLAKYDNKDVTKNECSGNRL